MSSLFRISVLVVVATAIAATSAGRLVAADPKVKPASYEVEGARPKRRTTAEVEQQQQQQPPQQQQQQEQLQQPSTVNELPAPAPLTNTGNSAEAYTPPWPEPPNTGAMLMRLFLGTIGVLCLCVGSIWLGKPWLKKLQVTGTTNPNFVIEGSVSVGNRAMLHLVRIGETQLVAGTDAGGLKSLIALPASFKDVLDNEIPEPEIPAFTPPKSLSAGGIIRPAPKV